MVAEVLPAQILLLLLHRPTDDSVEIAVALLKEVGQFLEEFNPAISMAVFDQLRSILHDSEVEKRTQYQIEVLFQIRKDKFRDNPSIQPELDLVEGTFGVTTPLPMRALRWKILAGSIYSSPTAGTRLTLPHHSLKN